MMEEKIIEEVIDVEPEWINLCRMVENERLPAKELRSACRTADMIRQAQKRGAKSITFSFPHKTGEARVEVRE